MAQYLYLHVLVQLGYYDNPTTYFNAKYTMWQIDPSGRMRDRFAFKDTRSSYKIYLRRKELEIANPDIKFLLKKLWQKEN